MSDKLKIMQERINSNFAKPMSECEIFALDALLYGAQDDEGSQPMSLSEIFALDAILAEADVGTDIGLHIFDGQSDLQWLIMADTSDLVPSEQTIVEPFFATPWGIDVSHHNGNIDWGRVEEAGVEFAFIKATEGASFVDSKFKSNFASAKAHDLLVGAYHFFQPNVAVEKQVDNFCRVYGVARNGDLPPVLDVENESLWKGVSKKRAADLVISWITGVRARLGEHVQPIIYASSAFVGDVLGADPRLKEYPLWVANYTRATKPRLPKPWSFWTFWQYTEDGRVAGISGAVDINRFNGDRGRLEALLMRK